MMVSTVMAHAASLLVICLALAALGFSLGASVRRADRLSQRIDQVNTRVDQVERDAVRPPTNTDLAAGLAEIRERMAGIEGGMEAQSNLLRTQNDYLHTLVEAGVNR